MNEILHRFVTELTPPIVLRCARPLVMRLRNFGAKKPTDLSGVSETPEQADEQYRIQGDVFRKHYTDSSYYFLWCIVADRLMRGLEPAVLEIGCGPGQFACLLRDKGIKRYSGIDFSAEAIAIARSSCPEYTFLVANIFETNVLETESYNTIVALEVLEHIQEDLEILRRIRPGTRVICSVPSFPYRFHVRHFSGCEEVARRYAGLFDNFHVDSLGRPGNRSWFFLFEGTRRQDS